MADLPAIPVITGPTGSGKTAVALALAREYPLEIVSADSRQVIRRLDIGTAKPTPEERRQAAFHLLDIIDPGEGYSAARFIDDASAAIEDILSRNRIPCVVGGTGLYLKALIDGVVELEEPDIELRRALQQEVHRRGPQAMWEELHRVDPTAAAEIHPHNTVRVLRALEIYRQTGRTRTELVKSGRYKRGRFEFACFCLLPDREHLYARINDRVEEMMRRGLLEEVRRLREDGLAEAVRQCNVIGYNELLDYLDGRYTLEEAVAMIQQNSRRYAKRQMTWFRGQMRCRDFTTPAALQAAVSELLGEWLCGQTEKG